MNARTLAFVSIVAVLTAVGCGEKDEPDLPPAPTVEVVPALEDAPAAIAAQPTGRYCGRVPVPERGGGMERRCLLSALESGEAASLTRNLVTKEGDPVTTTLVARPQGDVLVLVDTTRDSFGDRGWTAYGCRRISDRLALTDCSAQVAVGERTPSEVVGRPTLKSCGKLEFTLERLARVLTIARFYSPRLECFQRAVRRGESAEIMARSVTEEGPLRYYIRSLEDGDFEQFVDATRGGTGPPAWYLDTCDYLSDSLRLGRCEQERLPSG